MANNSNLISLADRTTEEKREIGIKGGKASGEVRRLKKTFKMALTELLNEEAKDNKGNPTGKTYQDLVNIGLLKGAMKGNAYNYKAILETIGELEAENEKSTPTININVVDNSNLERIMYEDNTDKQ